ncbi:cellulose binding domain-containing protein [Sorangium sp. So ce363]|uniref:cellulose binding domain-containing protein n=1 Tax=Sorangium sp. So ce363 TaxID=3133304 RepID=UPI003F61F34F
MHNFSFQSRWDTWVAAAALALLPACSDGSTESIGTSQAALQGANGISADRVMDSQWAQGYCAHIVVSNQHPSATTGTWSVALDVGPGAIFSSWDGTFSGSTGQITVTPQGSNAAIPPSESRQFGFCASIPSQGIEPVVLSVSSDLPPMGSGVAIAEYKFPAAIDAMVSPDYATELWASFYRPTNLEAGRQYPLLVFMHGNHPTCGTGVNPRTDNNNQYATTGTCPASYVVVPNHRGYDYMAEDLAARGYFVVSINTNRGIHAASGSPSDEFVIGPRGRLLLRHLERLSRWDSGAEPTPPELGVDLLDRIDFDQVGLLGHSRGGEAVRFAYNEYRRSGSPWPALIDSPVGIRGIFEIGPTDQGQNGQRLNADQTAWNVILPACDWDLSDLPGMRPFDRMMSIAEPEPLFKSFYHVWGANHNYYNSEWQIADGNSGGIQGCIDHEELFDPLEYGSPAQRETGRLAAVQFFTANVGADRDEAANALFDPAFPFPDVPYRVRRGYHPGGDAADSLLLEDFINPTGTSSYGLPNTTGGTLSVEHTALSGHDPSLSGAWIHDVAAGSATFFQSNWSAAGTGFDLTGYDYLDLRADRGWGSDPTEASFLVELVNADDTRSSAVAIDEFLELGPPPRAGTTLPTARIPLSSFSGATLASVRGVRLTFTTPLNGSSLYLANIRATRATTEALAASGQLASLASSAAPPSARARAAGATLPEQRRITAGNAIQSVRRSGSDAVELTLTSAEFFDLRATNLVLTVGAERSTAARHPNGDLHTVQFLLPRAAFDRLGAQEPVRVDYGPGSSVAWDFGHLDKTALAP